MADIYLDHAATSFPKPECVYQAMDQFMRQVGASPARGSYVRAQSSERILLDLRSRLSQFLGIQDPSNLVFTSNSTDALNLAIKGYLKLGDHVVTTDIEHNAVLRPLWALKKTKQIDVTIVRTGPLGEVNPDELMKAVTSKTRLITCTHASNVLGTVQPIEVIAQKARALGVSLLVDGSQTVGAYPLQVEEWGIDLFAFTGHKSLLGPTGTGGLYIRAGLDLAPLREGGNGSRSDSLDQPTTRPERYESGTPNMVGLAGLLAGVKYLEEVGVEVIRQHEVGLNRLLMDQLRAIPDVILHGPEAEAKVAITSMSLKSLDTVELGQILGKKFGIMVRTGLHCSPLVHQNLSSKEQGTVRFSLGWANTEQDVECAANAIREIAQTVYGKNADKNTKINSDTSIESMTRS